MVSLPTKPHPVERSLGIPGIVSYAAVTGAGDDIKGLLLSECYLRPRGRCTGEHLHLTCSPLLYTFAINIVTTTLCFLTSLLVPVNCSYLNQ